MATGATLTGVNMDDSRDSAGSSTSTAPAPASCNGSARSHRSEQRNVAHGQKTKTSSNSRAEYVTAPGEDDSKKPLLPKSRTKETVSDKKREPVILKDMNELQQHLELMHDRCIARNLRAAGLGGFEVEDEVIYGVLDPNAHMTTGETMLTATILFLKEPDRLHHYVSILLNDGADVNEQDGEGKTALMHAILSGRDKAAKAILRHEKTDLIIRDKDGNTALMHAAAIGSEMMLYYFFKALRKREKHQIQQQMKQPSIDSQKSSNAQSSTGADQKSSTGQKNGAAAIEESPTNGSKDGQELWSLLRSDDPLDIQNSRGETAHVIATKNGHVDCANLISDEKLKRAKEMNKRLNALNHHRSGSPSILRFAKRSAKKYLQHYGSFDSLYFDREDESDDELMIAGNQMRRSRTADPKAGVQAATKKSHPSQSGSNHQHKGFLLRLNKRFQSNPDLFRVKTNVNQEEIGIGPNDGQATLAIHEPTATTTKENEMEKIQNRGMPKSISGGMKQQQAISASQSHQPVIRSGTAQRRTSSSVPGHQPHKRNFTEKLMSFLRLRPKYFVPSSASDMTLCASSSAAGRDLKRNLNLNKKHSQQYADFNSIEQAAADDDDSALRKDLSQPDISPTERTGRHRQPRRGSAQVQKQPPPPLIPEPQQRRSVDLSVIPILHSQYLADIAPKFVDEWPQGNTVEEEAPADESMVTITPLPTSPPPMTPGASNLLKQAPKFNFPPLPP